MNSKSEEKSLIENLTHYVDNHLTEVRLSIYALGLIGVGVALRSIRFATKFYSNKSIPKSFVKKNISLRGVVKSISSDGTINVDHIPILKMPWHSRQKQNEKLLNVCLVSIEPNISGVYWLKLNVENKMIWFQIINKTQNHINCIASEEKKFLLKKNLNLELVQRGLAVVKPFDEGLGRIKSYKRLFKSLIASQNKAIKNNCGVWYRPTKWDAFKDRIQIFAQRFKF